MPDVIVETGSGTNPDANSLASVAEIDAYAAARPTMTNWKAQGVTATQKEEAAIHATTLLKRWVPWDGVAAVHRQPLPFPRAGCVDENGFPIDSDEVPTCVKEAQAELADALLEDADLEDDPEAGLSSLKADVITLNFDRYDRPGVLPRRVKAALRPVALFGNSALGKAVR